MAECSYVCVQCGVSGSRVTRGRGRKYCSPLCSSRALNDRRRADGRLKQQRDQWNTRNPEKAREIRRKANAKLRANSPEKVRQYERRRPQRQPAAKAARKRKRDALRRSRVAARGTASAITWFAGPCSRCGNPFVGRNGGRYCSVQCVGRRPKITKRQRLRVYERDGWVCRICGDLVNLGAVVPEDDAPVVDHRIPLAAGGAHCMSNWQTAHFYCNSVKRDQVDFDFAA